MRLKIHRSAQKRLTLFVCLTLMGCTGTLRAQHSYCESYLSHNLPSGAAGVQRVGEESAVVLFERQITEFRFVGNELDEFEVIHRKYQIFDENALSDLSSLYI